MIPHSQVPGIRACSLGTTLRITVLVIIKWYLKVAFIWIFGYHFPCVCFLFISGFMRLQRTEMYSGYIGWSGFILKYKHTLLNGNFAVAEWCSTDVFYSLFWWLFYTGDLVYLHWFYCLYSPTAIKLSAYWWPQSCHILSHS